MAMKMYRNYDGNKSTFGDTSILTTVPNPDNLSAFGAVRTSDGAMTLMVINKDLNNATPLTANITNFNATGTAQALAATANNVIIRQAGNHIAGGELPRLRGTAVGEIGDGRLKGVALLRSLLMTMSVIAPSLVRTAPKAERLSGLGTVVRMLVSPKVDLLPS